MIIPKRDAKYYGAVHIDNYLTFTGFCKKVDSDEICDVDVFVDGKKIDTLKADKKIGKVEDIYDIEGHGFEFDLSDEYFEKSHLLEFKASNGEELVNSKIQTIDKKHPKFNEYRFSHNLNFNIVEEKIQNLFKRLSLGFIGSDENMKNIEFMDYMIGFLTIHKDTICTIFYFNETQKDLYKKIFHSVISQVCFIIPKDIYDIASNVEIYYVPNYDYKQNGLVMNLLIKYSDKIFCRDFGLDYKGIKVKNTFDINKYKESNEFKFPEIFGYTNYEIANSKSTTELWYKKLVTNVPVDYIEKSLHDVFYISMIESILESETNKNFSINLLKQTIKLR